MRPPPPTPSSTSGGQISGTVDRALGCGHRCHGRPLHARAASPPSGWSWSDSATTTAGGAYSFTGLVPGAYRVCVDSATGLAPECWNDKPEVFAADTITAAKNSTATASFVLAAARKITGTVTSRAGGALTGPSVSVYRKLDRPRRAATGQSVALRDARGAAGRTPWTSRPAPTASPPRRTSTATASTASRRTSTRPARIVVAAGADQTGKDIALDRYGRISGTVSGPSGALAGATVRVYRWSNPSFVQVGLGADDRRRGVHRDRPQPRQLPGRLHGAGHDAGVQPRTRPTSSSPTTSPVALNGTATVNATLASNQRTLSGTVTAAVGRRAARGRRRCGSSGACRPRTTSGGARSPP